MPWPVTTPSTLPRFGAGLINLTLNGGDGNDLLIGSEGNDLIIGGRGNDTPSWAPATTPSSGTPATAATSSKARAAPTPSFQRRQHQRADRPVGQRLACCSPAMSPPSPWTSTASKPRHQRPRRRRHDHRPRPGRHRRHPGERQPGSTGAGDGAADSVIVNATAGADRPNRDRLRHQHLRHRRRSFQPPRCRGCNHTLTVNALAGDDVIPPAPASPPASFQLGLENGGDGDDVLIPGTPGNDVITGGNGDDRVRVQARRFVRHHHRLYRRRAALRTRSICGRSHAAASTGSTTCSRMQASSGRIRSSTSVNSDVLLLEKCDQRRPLDR